MGFLRFFLAVAVTCGHGHCARLHGFTMMYGDTALQTFFILSGFYMALVIDRKYRHADNWIRLFWLNRYIRIAPLYLTIAVAAALVAATSSSANVYDYADVAAITISVLSHILLIGQDVFVFFAYDVEMREFVFMPDLWQGGLARAGPQFVPGWAFLQIEQGWSIGVEIWFYLLAPFIVLRRLRVVVAIMILSLAIRTFLYNVVGWNDGNWDHRFFPNELFVFLLGVLSYRVYVRYKGHPALTAWAPHVLLFVLAGVVFYDLVGEIGMGGFERRWAYLFLVAGAIPFMFTLSRNWKVDRFLGDLSFPMYLSHLLILNLLAVYTEFGDWTGPVGLALTIAVSIPIVLWFERPITAMREDRLNASVGHIRRT